MRLALCWAVAAALRAAAFETTVLLYRCGLLALTSPPRDVFLAAGCTLIVAVLLLACRYDSMTALEMFRSFGITKQAYENFLKPTMLVRVVAGSSLALPPVTQPGVRGCCVQNIGCRTQAGIGRTGAFLSLPAPRYFPMLPALQVGLFAPPEELSAAVVVQTLYYYALAHQSDFDVCWCKGSGAPAGGTAAGAGAAGSLPAFFTCSLTQCAEVRLPCAAFSS